MRGGAMKKKTPWIVVDAKAQVFRCDRCKDTYPLANVVGQPVEIFFGLSSGFIKAHKQCKEPR